MAVGPAVAGPVVRDDPGPRLGVLRLVRVPVEPATRGPVQGEHREAVRVTPLGETEGAAVCGGGELLVARHGQDASRSPPGAGYDQIRLIWRRSHPVPCQSDAPNARDSTRAPCDGGPRALTCVFLVPTATSRLPCSRLVIDTWKPRPSPTCRSSPMAEHDGTPNGYVPARHPTHDEDSWHDAADERTGRRHGRRVRRPRRDRRALPADAGHPLLRPRPADRLVRRRPDRRRVRSVTALHVLRAGRDGRDRSSPRRASSPAVGRSGLAARVPRRSRRPPGRRSPRSQPSRRRRRRTRPRRRSTSRPPGPTARDGVRDPAGAGRARRCSAPSP